jgi:hypothetical protein
VRREMEGSVMAGEAVGGAVLRGGSEAGRGWAGREFGVGAVGIELRKRGEGFAGFGDVEFRLGWHGLFGGNAGIASEFGGCALGGAALGTIWHRDSLRKRLHEKRMAHAETTLWWAC